MFKRLFFGIVSDNFVGRVLMGVQLSFLSVVFSED